MKHSKTFSTSLDKSRRRQAYEACRLHGTIASKLIAYSFPRLSPFAAVRLLPFLAPMPPSNGAGILCQSSVGGVSSCNGIDVLTSACRGGFAA